MIFKNISLVKKLIFIFLLLIIPYILFSYLYYQTRLRQYILFLSDKKDEYTYIFDKIMELKSSFLIRYAYDYTYWDEMVNFILHSNLEWAEDNIKTSLSTYDADMAWIYNLEGENLYFISRSNMDVEVFKNILPISKESLKELFKENYLKHFFLLTPYGPLEVVGATVHPSKDKERKTPPQGYFFTARLWSEAYFKELDALTVLHVEFTPYKPKEEIILPEGKINFVKELLSWKGYTLGYLNCVYRNKFIADSFTRLRRFFFVLSFIVILLCLGLFFLFYFVIIRPLFLIRKALLTSDISRLGRLKERNDEIGSLAKIVLEHVMLESKLKEEIKNRSLLEEKLKASQHYLQEIMNKVDFGIMLIEPQTHKIIDINETALKMLDLTKEEVLNKECFEFVCPAERGKCPITDLNQKIDRSERVLLKAGKIEIPILKSVYPVNIDNQEYLLESFVDIRDRKEIENKMLKLNHLLRILSEINQMIVKTKEEEILFKETCRILVEIGDYKMAWVGLVEKESKRIKPVAWWGYVGDYLEGINISIDPDKPEGRGPSGNIIRSGRSFVCNEIESAPYMEPWKEKALKHGFYSTAGFPIRKGSEVIGLFRVYSAEKGHFTEEEVRLLNELSQDLSFALENLEKERKRLQQEKELLLAYERLKNMQAQLLQSEKMASLGQLSAGIAHEINNPLVGILNNIQLLKISLQKTQESPQPELKEIVDKIEESALRCKKIIQSMLSFSRTSKAKFELLSLNELIEEVLSLIQTEFGLQNICINKNLSGDLPRLFLDRQLIQQAILNLLNNSAWAIKEKKTDEPGQINITTQYNAEEREVIFSVSDNGIGMEQEILEHIFEPFFTTKDIGEGTGLGLAMVYNVVQHHNAKIEVKSKKNQGTTFIIRFPTL